MKGKGKPWCERKCEKRASPSMSPFADVWREGRSVRGSGTGVCIQSREMILVILRGNRPWRGPCTVWSARARRAGTADRGPGGALGQGLRKLVAFPQDWTPSHTDAAEVRPRLPNLGSPLLELDERRRRPLGIPTDTCPPILGKNGRFWVTEQRYQQ